MRELLGYLATIPWQNQGIDGKAWVKIDKIIEDTDMTREEIYKMASRAKPKGFIRWSFLGLHSIECLSRLSITTAGKQWLGKTEEITEEIKVSPEFLMKVHPLR